MNTELSLKEGLGEIIARLDKLNGKVQSSQKMQISFLNYSTNEAAKLLSISTRTLAKYRQQRKIGYVQIGRKILFTQAHIDAFLENFKVDSFTSKVKFYGRY